MFSDNLVSDLEGVSDRFPCVSADQHAIGWDRDCRDFRDTLRSAF
jgi:hypothetical protein